MTTSVGSNIHDNVGGASSAISAAGSSPGAGNVIAAGGATVSGGIGMVSAVAALIPATLSCFDTKAGPKKWGVIPFDFNPTKIGFLRSAQGSSVPVSGPGAGNPAGSSGEMVWKSDPPEITISEIVFEGLSTKIRCDGLFNWMSPPGGEDPFAATMAAMGRPVPSEVPTLRFMWGPPIVGFLYKVRLTRCQVSYERFSPTGIPVRARVSLTMKQVPDVLSAIPTNPTSGGAPGRRTHVLKAGESLHSVAHTYYGEAGAWRRIAAVNGIDDPARVRPGTTVYLPNGQELEQAGGR